MQHKRFSYQQLSELQEDILMSGVDLPVSENIDILKQPLALSNGKMLSNRLVIHPMEGCDGMPGGAPGELTFRRYRRFSAGGAGLLWMEACAVVHEGRANPRQILLNRENLPVFGDLVDEIRRTAAENNVPYLTLQLTHSGRYSKPNVQAEAIVAVPENPYIDPFTNPKRRMISDDELEQLEDKYVEAAKLAESIGFHAVDIKACHRYLISELLSAYTRPGRYGGSFENRTRFLLNIIDKVRDRVNIDITLRMNAYDAIPYPYGWGTDENGNPATEEPKQLMKILENKGISIINLTTGNPYYNPHIGRPSDIGPYVAPEHPIESAARMLHVIRELKSAVPSLPVIGTGFSWFREYGANIAAGCIEKGWIDLAGFGRQSFAYPDFANDLLTYGKMERKKCCIACTKCTELMRFGREAGCVIKDGKTYLPIWKAATNGQTMMSNRIGTHI
ncbi:MAG: NADH:flavin oxidoreductase [Tannerella sp.]|jgi:2,4-dienoyl-CoA reductase-like NADH-dependent reductase (Old Yellow Enzyme family)|nr:NADH:flavin oxidoreductase [Tannerella sp.]